MVDAKRPIEKNIHYLYLLGTKIVLFVYDL